MYRNQCPLPKSFLGKEKLKKQEMTKLLGYKELKKLLNIMELKFIIFMELTISLSLSESLTNADGQIYSARIG